jgi:hypothetical protein
MKKSEIISAIIAAFGAVLSTIAVARQWRSDRVKVKLTVQGNMQMVGYPRHEGITLTVFKRARTCFVGPGPWCAVGEKGRRP